MSRLSDDEKRFLTDQITMLKGENERLTKYIEDYEDDTRKVLADECAPDEKHCACVPVLRAEIDVLRNRKFVYVSESGLPRMICMISGEPWMCYKHADGQWVTLKKIALLADTKESVSLSEVKEKYLPNRDLNELRGVDEQEWTID